MAAQDKDLGTTDLPVLDWSDARAEESLRQVFGHCRKLAQRAGDWYLREKKAKRFFARGLRVAAIVLGTLAALVPAFNEIVAELGWVSKISPMWSTVLVGVVGMLLLLDRFFGFSSGWMRFISTELQIRQLTQDFEWEWEIARASFPPEAPPPRERVLVMLDLARGFIGRVNDLVLEETNAWMREFERTVRDLDKQKP